MHHCGVWYSDGDGLSVALTLLLSERCLGPDQLVGGGEAVGQLVASHRRRGGRQGGRGGRRVTEVVLLVGGRGGESLNAVCTQATHVLL